MKIKVILKGGEGSGNFSHAGRPGEVGGSAPSNYVRTKIRLNDGSTKTIWATEIKKGGMYYFTKVDAEGNVPGSKMQVYVCAENDVLWRKPAVISNKYATLEIE